MRRGLKSKIIYRYLTPLLLLGIVVEIFILLPKSIDKNTDSFVGSDIPLTDAQDSDQSMKGVHLVEAHESSTDWELWADKAYNFREDGSWKIEKVKVRIKGDGNVFYDVFGDTGFVNPKKKNIVIDGDVKTITSNGYLLKNKTAVYQTDKKILTSDSEIKMYGPETEGESRLELTGYGMETDLNTNELKILKDVRAEKVLKKGQRFLVTSRNALFNSVDYTAFFKEDVVVDYGAYRVTSQEAKLEVEPRLHQVEKVTMTGQVKLSDIQHWAVANKVELYVEQKKIVMSGSPRLIQDQNELSGEEITIYQGTSQIQVKRPKAKFEKNFKRSIR